MKTLHSGVGELFGRAGSKPSYQLVEMYLTVVIFIQFRNLDVPTGVRLGELLAHLQGKGEEACREFYRALHLHVEEVYYSLPTRLRLRGLFPNTFSLNRG